MNKQEIIKRIEDIEQGLTSLQLTMELLATSCGSNSNVYN